MYNIIAITVLYQNSMLTRKNDYIVLHIRLLRYTMGLHARLFRVVDFET